MKKSLFFFIISVISFSSDAQLSIPSGNWILNSDQGDYLVEISDSTVNLSMLSYSCDTTTFGSFSSKFKVIRKDSLLRLTFEFLSLGNDDLISIEFVSKNEGLVHIHHNDVKHHLGKLIKTEESFKSYKARSKDERQILLMAFAQNSLRNSLEFRIEDFSKEVLLSSSAKAFIAYLDSLESQLIKSLESNYDQECFYKDQSAYLDKASEFLIGDNPSLPSEKHFSASSLESKLKSYYLQLEQKESANDFFDFNHIILNPNDPDWKYSRETWAFN